MILPIVVYGHEALRRRAVSVSDAAAVQGLITDMIETLNAAGGVGLAANQVNRPEAVIIVAMDGEAVPIINPEIVSRSGLQESEEGCLSVPDIYATIDRAARITVHGLSMHGEEIELVAEGFVAVIIQHEIDHLEGKLFLDYVSPVKKVALKGKILSIGEKYPTYEISVVDRRRLEH